MTSASELGCSTTSPRTCRQNGHRGLCTVPPRRGRAFSASRSVEIVRRRRPCERPRDRPCSPSSSRSGAKGELLRSRVTAGRHRHDTYSLSCLDVREPCGTSRSSKSHEDQVVVGRPWIPGLGPARVQRHHSELDAGVSDGLRGRLAAAYETSPARTLEARDVRPPSNARRCTYPKRRFRVVVMAIEFRALTATRTAR